MPSPDSTYIIGIDSGGTEMRGCLLRGDGLILARATAPAANYNKLRGEIAQSVIALAQSLCESARISREQLDLAGFCATGVGRPADRRLVTEVLREARLAKEIVVESDALGALTGAFAGEPGIIVSAGTGAFAYARTHAGEIVRVGGWGYLLGDEGSGYHLAKSALNAALQDWDGRGERTALRAVFEKHFGVQSIELIITQIYDPAFDRGRVAALAPLVFAAAEQGDLVAKLLAAQTGFELGKLARAAVQKFEAGVHVPVALLGKIFSRAEMLLPSFWKALQEEQGRLQIVAPRFEPVIGAALLAVQSTGLSLDESFLENLQK
jgi:N-acetylglucosamine kinase